MKKTSLDQLRQRFQSTNDKPSVESVQPGQSDFDQRLEGVRDALKGMSEGAPAVHTGDDTRSEPEAPVKGWSSSTPKQPPKPKLPPKPAKAPRAPGRAPLPHGPDLDATEMLAPPPGYVLEGQKSLHFRDQRSDKVYIVEVLRQEGTEAPYTVRARYGRRGKTLKTVQKGIWGNKGIALREMNVIAGEKAAKGYRYGLNP